MLYTSEIPVLCFLDTIVRHWMGTECSVSCGGQGPCDLCGKNGMCCTQRKGWNDTNNGCNGLFGGPKQHECVQIAPIGEKYTLLNCF